MCGLHVKSLKIGKKSQQDPYLQLQEFRLLIITRAGRFLQASRQCLAPIGPKHRPKQISIFTYLLAIFITRNFQGSVIRSPNQAFTLSQERLPRIAFSCFQKNMGINRSISIIGGLRGVFFNKWVGENAEIGES
jgi:hypothetical protein